MNFVYNIFKISCHLNIQDEIIVLSRHKLVVQKAC